MKLNQKKVKYTPITIVLETEDEAIAFLGIVDMSGNMFDPESDTGMILTELSNAVTNRDVYIP
jgi:hypothetical protein